MNAPTTSETTQPTPQEKSAFDRALEQEIESDLSALLPKPQFVLPHTPSNLTAADFDAAFKVLRTKMRAVMHDKPGHTIEEQQEQSPDGTPKTVLKFTPNPKDKAIADKYNGNCRNYAAFLRMPEKQEVHESFLKDFDAFKAHMEHAAYAYLDYAEHVMITQSHAKTPHFFMLEHSAEKELSNHYKDAMLSHLYKAAQAMEHIRPSPEAERDPESPFLLALENRTALMEPLDLMQRLMSAVTPSVYEAARANSQHRRPIHPDTLVYDVQQPTQEKPAAHAGWFMTYNNPRRKNLRHTQPLNNNRIKNHPPLPSMKKTVAQPIYAIR